MPTPSCPAVDPEASAPDPGTLFVRYAQVVRRALARLGVPDASLDDAVQDVFVVLVRRIGAYDRTRSLTNWLWGIARGVASTHRRTRRRRDRLHAAASVLRRSDAVLADAPVERAVASREAQAILRDFLDTLDDDKCAVFVLAEIEGCTGPEIACRLDLNVNTVYARLRAARRRFDDAVAQHRPAATGGWLALAWSKVLPASAPAWIPATASSALAAALVLPVALPVALPTFDAGADDDVIVIEDDASREPERLAKEEGDAALAAAAQENPTMRIPAATLFAATTLAAATAHAKPTKAGDTWRVESSDQDADAAALTNAGDGEIVREYVFDNDTVDGENLGPDGTILIQPPNVRFGSLLDIRGHFIPELITLATDV